MDVGSADPHYAGLSEGSVGTAAIQQGQQVSVTGVAVPG